MGADVNHPHGETPLMIAAGNGNTDLVRLLAAELGADINQAWGGRTPLIRAAYLGLRAMVRCLVEAGAKMGAVGLHGATAFLESARLGHYATTQYLLEGVGANIEDVNKYGETVWDLLTDRLKEVTDDDEDEEEHALVALAGLLRVLVLRGAPPPALVSLLSPEDTDVVQEGARLRARLPAYLAHRRAYLDLRCPRISLLPSVLRALIYGFEGPATTEELWATGLGTAVSCP
jgi:hypothetical protein